MFKILRDYIQKALSKPPHISDDLLAKAIAYSNCRDTSSESHSYWISRDVLIGATLNIHLFKS